MVNADYGNYGILGIQQKLLSSQKIWETEEVRVPAKVVEKKQETMGGKSGETINKSNG